MPPDEHDHASPIVADMRVTVMGIGRFGGGAGVVRHLLDRGCRVLATDLLDESALEEVVRELRSHPNADRLELRLGRHETRDFIEADLVVANPAVPRPGESAFLNAARKHDVPITTEIRLAVDALPKRRFVGVTGSSGKSSTASMIHHALGELGVPTALGGNIGGSLLDEAPKVDERAWVVLELSSFMLHWLGEDRRPWSPHLAVLTNLGPNHLDWHGDLASYVRAKSSIVSHRRDGRFLTAFHREHPTVSETMADAAGDWWSSPARETEHHWHAIEPDAIDLKVIGSHSAATPASRSLRSRPFSRSKRSITMTGSSTARSASSPAFRIVCRSCLRSLDSPPCGSSTTRSRPRPKPRCWRSRRSRILHASI